MTDLKVTRRTFLKGSAALGAAALFPPTEFKLEGLSPKASAPSQEQLVKSSCRQCYGRCGLIAHVQDGKITRIEGWPEAPNSRGRLCAKAFAIPQLVYNPNRITYPMKRMGARGEGNWQRISWDEAYSTVATKFKELQAKYGPATIANFRGTGRDFIWSDFFTWFNLALGSYVGASGGHICFVSSVAESTSLLGDEMLTRGADVPKTKLMIWWGKNAFGRDHTPAHSLQALDAMARGVKFVEIDPRYTNWASKADLWLPVRPGTDVAIALAMIKIVIDNKFYDQNFLTKYSDAPFLVNGTTKLYLRQQDNPPVFMVWDEATNSAQPADAPGVKPALLGSYTVNGVACKPVFQLLADGVQQWTPEKAADVTWVPADRIRQAGMLYGQNSPGASLLCGHKKDTGINASGFTHALDILVTITGNLEVEGGNIFAPDMGVRVIGFNAYGMKPGYRPKTPPAAPQKEALAITTRYPFTRSTNYMFWQTVKAGGPLQIKGAFVQTSNPLLGMDDAKNMYDAIKQLEFIVTVDWANTPMTSLSDIVLPAAMPYEVNDLVFSATTPLPTNLGLLLMRSKVIEPLGEAKDDCTIDSELADQLKLSRDTFLPYKTRDDYINFVMEPLGMTFNQLKEKGGFITRPIVYRRYATGGLRPDGKPGFSTATGRAQLYSEIMLTRGWGPLPIYVEPPESPISTPDLAKQYPLICIAGARDPTGYAFFHTEYRQVPWMRELHPNPTVVIHPDTAQPLGIAEGDWVWLETRKGRVRMQALVSRQVRPEVVSADHDGWYPEKPGTEPTLYGVWDSNINVVTNGEGPYDPATGSNLISGFLCKVYKATEGAPEGIAQVTSTRTL